MKPSVLFSNLLGLLILAMACHENEAPNPANDIFIALPSPPVKVKNTEGTWLVYDMHVTAAEVEKVEIFNNGEMLLRYTDFITVGEKHIASIWLPFPPQGWPDKNLTNDFQYTDAEGNTKQYRFNFKLEDAYPEPITIAFPVPSGVWLAEGAPGSNSYHTRALFPFSEPILDPDQQGYLFGNNPQRYAIDYALLVNGLPYENDGTALEDWYCYNLPIYAAQGGKVLFTEDGIPDNQTPGGLDYPTDETNATGNVVYIEHADGSIGTYCHMVPNSILVQAGDVVATGQQLGRLGNSGNSFAPHLHMHVMTNPEGKEIVEYSDGLYMESLPYAFAQFTKLGALPPGYLDEKPIYPFHPTQSETFAHCLPAESDVIAF